MVNWVKSGGDGREQTGSVDWEWKAQDKIAAAFVGIAGGTECEEV